MFVVKQKIANSTGVCDLMPLSLLFDLFYEPIATLYYVSGIFIVLFSCHCPKIFPINILILMISTENMFWDLQKVIYTKCVFVGSFDKEWNKIDSWIQQLNSVEDYMNQKATKNATEKMQLKRKQTFTHH